MINTLYYLELKCILFFFNYASQHSEIIKINIDPECIRTQKLFSFVHYEVFFKLNTVLCFSLIKHLKTNIVKL